MTRPYLRFPHIAGDQLVFTADDDVWLVASDGGRAARLSSDRVRVSRPRLSPDGADVAWVSGRDGAGEVYVMPTAGGDPRRLTHWSDPAVRLHPWVDGAPVASSAVGTPFRSHTHAHRLDLDGGPARRLPYGPLSGLLVVPGGPTVVQTSIFRDPATWKRYRGGTAPAFWIDADGSGQFAPFLRELAGQLADPGLCAGRIVFLSDHEGHNNVYSVAPDGSGLRRHTDHSNADPSRASDVMWPRNLSTDGTRAVYQQGGELWVLDSVAADSQPRRLDVTLPGARSGRLPQRPDVADSLTDLDVDATGRASVVGVHGTVQWLTHRDGPVRALADTPGVRARLPRVAGRDGAVVWVTDADGDDALEHAAATDAEPVRLAAGELGRVLELEIAPDGSRAAVATHDGRVLVVDLPGGAVRELHRSTLGDAQGLAFSPDSQWLAWSAPGPAPLRGIVLARVDSDDEPVIASPTRFVDTEPCFTPDGRYLAFLSARTFDPVYDEQNFDLGFPLAVRPYLLPLAADTPSPFDPQLDGRAMTAPDKDADAPDAAGAGSAGAGSAGTGFAVGTDAGTADAAPVDSAPVVRVDPDGLPDRVSPVPVPAALYGDLRAARGGLLWTHRPVSGVIGVDRAPGESRPALRLARWDFDKQTVVDLLDSLDEYAVSGDGTRIVARVGGELKVGPADRKVEDPDPGEVVTVDLDRVRLVVDPIATWRQMTTETWRLMRDHFWVADMAGVDWDAVLHSYLPIVDRLATRDDLSELLWEMIGELGTSHAYERQPPVPDVPGAAAAFLGADFVRDDDGRWRIERILPGEASVPAARSPLLAAGVRVAAGDLLVAVDGRPVGAAGPAPLLAGLAHKPVELTVERDGAVRRVVVVPTDSEEPLRYQAWVSNRRAATHELSGGRVGYVHVPDMMSTGWAEFHRDLRGETTRDALLVDTRENGGGHTSQLVIERLARRVLAREEVRHKGESTYPNDAPRGPLLSLANAMSGSDGDIVNEAFKELGLGPVVGTRTWGGVIGIDGRYDLVDGTSVTQPRYAYFFDGSGWDVENHGVDPDVEVPMPPQVWANGEDPQLETGVRMLLEALESHRPLAQPDPSTRPSRVAPPLPPRP